ncbi:hypothetical protein MNV49_006437 [Pseudohyphozyma bogoriensis]|nr:hypothetical protein MNV49_006437 [Pseudohyphozyma bogoriensis]
MSSPPAPEQKRTKITLVACDRCKSSKRKCDGLHPCGYCVNTKKLCTYDVVDRRRKTPLTIQKASTSATASTSSTTSRPSPALFAPSPSTSNSAPVASTSTASFTPRRSPASTASNLHVEPTPPGHVPDDANLALLANAMAHEHLSPSEQTPEGVDLSRDVEGNSVHPSFAGAETEDLEDARFDFAFLPERSEALMFINCYFEAASATYRYLDRETIQAAAKRFYDGDPAVTGDTDAVCLLLLVVAVGCLWTPSWTNADPALKTPQAINLYRAAKQRLSKSHLFPPRLVTVQINLLMVQLHLGLTQFQSAWVTFGHAARIAQLLGLHRCSAPAHEGTPADEIRRRVFWSAFMMDRYLSLVVGFPVLFDERDITQRYFSVPPSNGSVEARTNDQALIGSLAHVKLSLIMGHAIRLLGRRDLSPAERDQAVAELDAELEQWKLETPSFFHPSHAAGFGSDGGGFLQVPEFFQRQQRVVHCAFHFLRLFTYRGYLLSSFLDHLPGTRPTPISPNTVIPPQVRICVDAAVSIASISAKIAEVAAQRQSKFGGTFWNTSYFTFASLTVLCVYTMLYEHAPDRDQIAVLIEGAMRGHELLAGSTADERQNILSESRRIGGLLKRPPGADRDASRSSSAGGTTADASLAVPAATADFGFAQDLAQESEAASLSNWDWMWLVRF